MMDWWVRNKVPSSFAMVRLVVQVTGTQGLPEKYMLGES